MTTAAILVSGCANNLFGDSGRSLPEEPAIYTLTKKIELTEPSFESNIPEEALSRFKVISATDVDSEATLFIDSSGDRQFFPILEQRRAFRSKHDVSSFIAEMFGGQPITEDGENKFEVVLERGR